MLYRICGFFDFGTPVSMIRDPGILKKLTVKDFDHFEDHCFFVDFEQQETLFSLSLFMLMAWLQISQLAWISSSENSSPNKEQNILNINCIIMY